MRRDGLAGLFDDRTTRRFGFDDVTRQAVLAALAALLLSIASSRLSWPTRAVPVAQDGEAKRYATATPPPGPLGTLLEKRATLRSRLVPSSTEHRAPEQDVAPRGSSPAPPPSPPPPAEAPPPPEGATSSVELLAARGRASKKDRR